MQPNNGSAVYLRSVEIRGLQGRELGCLVGVFILRESYHLGSIVKGPKPPFEAGLVTNH